ncbi:site-specific integrase [soil metagenome]
MSMKYFFVDQPTLSKYHVHPLGKYLNSYAAFMHNQGFARHTGRKKIGTISKFSRWLKRYGVRADEVSVDIIDRYVHRKGRKYRPSSQESITLKQFGNFLASERVIAKNINTSIPPTAINEVTHNFAIYLKRERGLSAGTIDQYKRHIVLFLTHVFPQGEPILSVLRVPHIIEYVKRKAHIMSRKVAKMMTTALRSFLRYIRYQGYVDFDLAASVPAVASWAMVSIPRALPREQVEKVLSNCDRKTAIGQRDYAILLLITRLGLRAGEIVSLRLEDVDWRAGRLTVHGKNKCLSHMPLPSDVGEAIAIYLQKSRPKSLSRSLFLREQAPRVGFARTGAVSNIVRRALQKAGVQTKHFGAHQFRHGLATHLLQTGGSLTEISEILRHRTIQSTTMYAKVDLVSLQTLGLPWPGGVQ